jgi:ferrous iron transport protein A
MKNGGRDEKMTEHFFNSLDEVPAGKRFLVRQLRGGKDFVSRMATLGFTEGVDVQMIQNYGRGPLIALVRGVRVALGHGEALKVLVEDVSHDQETDHK